MSASDSLAHKSNSGYPPSIISNSGDFDTEKYHCPVCNNFIKNAFQAECGHRYCEGCIEYLKSSGKKHCLRCLEDGEPISDEISLKDVFPDKAFRREMFNIKCKCLNDRCPWVGKIKDLDNHLQACPFKSILCECGKSIQQEAYDYHKKNECIKRKIACDLCSTEIIWEKKQEHYDNSCPKIKVSCDLCGDKIAREEISSHQDGATGSCKRDREPCKFNNGTTHKIFLKRNEMKTHMTEAASEHLDLIHDHVCNLRVSSNTSNQSSDLNGRVDILSSDLEDLRETTDMILADIGQMPESIAGGGNIASGSNGQIEKNVLPVLCQEIDRNDDEIREMRNTCRLLEGKISELEENLTSWKKEVIMKELLIKEQRLQIENLRNTSYDGTLIFKLDKFENKKRQAQMNKLTSHYSVPFFTSRTGHKMCIRVYPNGDGNGRGTHLSVFFVVMRGPYDALLKWPFNKKVTFILLDQTERAEHVTDAFRPDPSSNSFKRPTTEMNIASGSPVFVSQTILNQKKRQYLKDDCLFIKVVVDCS